MEVLEQEEEYINVASVRVDEYGGGGFYADEEEAISSCGDDHLHLCSVPPANGGTAFARTSELTITFEGEVYVFPAITLQKGVDDGCTRPNISRRIASLVRFRERRKERCFEKKICFTCRKEVAQRMHRKNGQFASSKEDEKTADNIDSGDSTPRPEPTRLRALRLASCTFDFGVKMAAIA